jgi:SAM-dependent methyltransferase
VTQVDEKYSDVRLARLYDAECPWHPQDDFYLDLDLRAESVLDVGCGTGTRLARAREEGHPGLLVGVDPAPGMLALARGKTDQVQWIHGDAQTVQVGRRFQLLTMTGHAFQTLRDDESVLAALLNFNRHLTRWVARLRDPQPAGPGVGVVGGRAVSQRDPGSSR